MLKSKIDLNLLVALNALLREKNVSKAAKKLAISQSSASNALARLREIYNDPLLVRVGRSYELSPLALQLVDPVQTATQDLNAIFSWRDQLDLSQETKTIRIAARDYITALLLPKLLKTISAQAPGITLSFSRFDGGSLDQLADGNIDFVVISDLYEHNFPSEVLYKEGWSCIVCENNKTIPQRLSKVAYLNMDHVIFLPGPGKRVSATPLVTKTDLQRNAVATVDDYALIPPLIRNTQFIATLPNKIARLMQKDMGLRLIKPPHYMPQLSQNLCWNPRNTHSPIHHWMVKRLVEAAVNL